MEEHDGDFLSSTSATRRAMTRGRGGNGNNDKRPSPRGFETKFVATPLQSSSHENWRGERFPSDPSPSYSPVTGQAGLISIYLAGEDELTKNIPATRYRINHLTSIDVDIEHPDDGNVLIA